MIHFFSFIAFTAPPRIMRRLTVASALAVCMVFTAALAADETPEDEKDSQSARPPATLRFQLDASHSTLGPNVSDLYIRIRVKVAKVKAEGRRPINLALVFDRSGSMAEDAKIGYLRQAGHLVADNLTPQDQLAMIAYNHEVQTLVPMHPVVNREYLHHRIDELHAEGQTNLSGGLLEGCAAVRKRINEPGLHHVILLTDGLANRGIWQPDALVQLVRRCTADGITVTTFGVGTEYNETLLGRMAQAGGGRYVYVAKPEEIPAAFKQELGTLLAVVAQNAKLKMKLPVGVEVKQIFGWEEPQKPGQLEMRLGDLTSGEERVVLVKLRLDGNSRAEGGEGFELPMVLTYDDVAQARRIESVQTAHIERSGRTNATDVSPVLAYAQLVEAVDKIAVAVASMDRKAAAEVVKIHRYEYPKLKKVAWASRDQDFVNKAYMFEHYARELQELIDHGMLHEHSAERAKLQKELHFRRYLKGHHQHNHH